MKYVVIKRYAKVWPVVVQCDCLGASGYRQHVVRQKAVGRPVQPGTRLSQMALAVHVKVIFHEMKVAYGWPRIW